MLIANTGAQVNAAPTDVLLELKVGGHYCKINKKYLTYFNGIINETKRDAYVPRIGENESEMWNMLSFMNVTGETLYLTKLSVVEVDSARVITHSKISELQPKLIAHAFMSSLDYAESKTISPGGRMSIVTKNNSNQEGQSQRLDLKLKLGSSVINKRLMLDANLKKPRVVKLQEGEQRTLVLVVEYELDEGEDTYQKLGARNSE